MGFSALFTFIITLSAAALLISERLRPDLIAVCVLVILGISGIVPPYEVFSGFGGTVVMTILGISIISTGLHQTGVTLLLGRFMHRIGRDSDLKLVMIVLLVSAALSLVMNNIAAVGVLLPAVMSLSRRNQISPGRLLMPLAYGSILGGMATLLTTSNIIISDALRNAGYTPFRLLDFLPVGGLIVLVGAVYMLTIGRRMLPRTFDAGQARTMRQLHQELTHLYQLNQNLYEIEILPDSPLGNISIAEGHWARRVGLNITGLIRNHQTHYAPNPDVVIQVGDRLLVQGNPNLSTLVEHNLRLI
ncbi:MAG: SLC13 family permease, partial [Anaerolineaceae bacterium]|nr:SLC13 family permease [Anaerolineaceae bacterium]